MKRCIPLSFCILLSIFLLQACGKNHKPSPPENEMSAKPQEVLIKFTPEAAADSVRSLTASAGLVLIKEIKGINVKVYRVPQDQSVDALIKTLSANPNVEYAEPNLTYRTQDKNKSK